jgi:tRNA nucleotidyltransferase (CCA-adding enzyme)
MPGFRCARAEEAVSEMGIDAAADGAKALERLRRQPGGPELLELAGSRDDMELVGGAVRDLLLERTPRELDVVVAADAPALAQSLAQRLGADATVYERFGTAVVEHGEIRLDFATRRAESYPAPGALPEVRPGTPLEDLLRRDFTVNAIAVALGGARAGELRAVPDALEDLRAGRLRVLHEQSFVDDPTRLLRLARYSVRLGFAVEPGTEALARRAPGALETVSGARIGAELRLALCEAQAPAVLEAMQELGLLRAIHPRLRFELPLTERALALLPRDGSRQTLLLAALMLALVAGGDGEPQTQARALLDRLEFPQSERDRALATATAVPRLLDELPRCTGPSQLYALASDVPLEGVVLAGALAQAGVLAGALGAEVAGAAAHWLNEIRYVRLEISGVDLLSAGVPEGPEIGRRLQAALRARLDGQLAPGREAELRAALAA